MSDFNEIREKLNQTLSQQQESERKLYLFQEKLNQIQERIQHLNRGFNSDNPKDSEAKYQLENQKEALVTEIQEGKAKLEGIRKNLHEFLGHYQKFSDPRQSISEWNDHNPIMLLPLRIETRFKTIQTQEGLEQHQLWVRIYPDDIAIDSFEEFLSENEVENAKDYWLKMWQAGGRESMERGSWQGLVSSFGSGRARYILENYSPVNDGTDEEKPDNATLNQFFLTVAVEEKLEATEIPTLKTFWKNLWLAGTDIDKQNQAKQALLDELSGTVEEKENRFNEILTTLKPSNFDDFSRYSEEDLEVKVLFVRFPKKEAISTKSQSWSQAPKTQVMPDRFVITAYNGTTQSPENISFQEIGNLIPSNLTMGPDPSLSKEEQLQQLNGELKVNKDLEWMFDFEKAVAQGMGFKINLDSHQRRAGFDRIVVVGVKLSSDINQSVESIETLFKNHERSKKGLAILPQGTPTNNTSSSNSGYSFVDDADVSFELLKKEQQFNIESDWIAKKDGQWLAELLGIKTETFQKTYNASLTDQSEARAMNLALFPATLGYMMESMMKEVFSEEDVENTRFFFHNYVTARGMIPAIKIGRQPYGILPTTKFNSMHWLDPKRAPIRLKNIPWQNSMEVFLFQLYTLLKKIDKDWEILQKEVAYVGKKGQDAQQLLLDIVGLTPNSIEYYQRYAESEKVLTNRLIAEGKNPELIKDLLRIFTMNLLGDLGYNQEEVPEILKKFFFQSQNKLKSSIIDDVPLSETEPIRKYTTDGKNYLEWLQKASEESHDALRLQKDFIDNKVPTTLLYLMLKHSLDLGYINTSLQLNLKYKGITADQYRLLKSDPEFLHITPNTKETESRWKLLYEKNAKIPGGNHTNLGNLIPNLFATELKSSYLKQQLEALDYLKNAPTARLERAFVEHIDLCTYRLDAWKNALMHVQLSYMRYEGFNSSENNPNYTYSGTPTSQKENTKGTYLGAYGWLEDVRPENKTLKPVHLDDDLLKENFNQTNEPQLVSDSTNGGYIGALSLNHAVTAAILRNAYKSDNNPEVFEINLSSERVRKALAFIEGIREGQNLAALLGYYFERELHDQNHSLTKVDFYIHLLRKEFPLVSNKIKSTQVQDIGPDETVEGNNVIDGLALINHIKKTGKKDYPFGKPNLPNAGIDAPSPEIKAAILEQVNNIMNLNDALADVAIAESVHQAVLGNHDRAAATLDTYSKGNFPPIPEVIQTPRKGINITQRFGLQFKAGITPGLLDNPRTKAEPALANWLKEFVLPKSDEIQTKVTIIHANGTEDSYFISQNDLGLEAIDLLFMLNTDDEKSMTALDDYIENYIIMEKEPRPDAEIKILYTERISGKTNFFQLASQLESLRRLLLQSRPLEPMDVALPIEANSAKNDTLFLDESRIEKALMSLKKIIDEVNPLIHDLAPLLADKELNKDALRKEFDPRISKLIELLTECALYGIPQTGTGFLYEKKRAIFKAIISKLEKLVERWTEKRTAFEHEIDLFDALPATTSDEDKFLLLYKAESYISTHAETPQPDTPENFRIILMNKKNAFNTKLTAFTTILSNHYLKVNVLINDIKIVEDISNFDPTPIDMTEQENAMVQFVEEIYSHAESLKSDIESRISKAETMRAEANNLANGKEKVELIQEAAKLLFGEDFKMIPEFILQPEQANEWSNSYNDSEQLIHYLKTTEERDFPLDEWVYSLGRVREKVRDWEKIVSLSEAFTGNSLELKPVQLPYQPNDSWLAFDFPKGHKIDNDKILYTAHYASDFVKNGNQCGLLLDEWTEVIPSESEDVGVTFHYDRPNSEPPQVILMAMPSEFKGAWNWEELMDAVNDTLNQAKKRAIEPQQIDKTLYARFLPATISSVTSYPLSTSLNFSFVNQIVTQLNPQNNESE